MKIRKPTVTICIDGKGHDWLVVNEDTDIINRTRWERRWCQKCGTLTQCTIDATGKAKALLTDKKRPHLVVPQLTKLMVKG